MKTLNIFKSKKQLSTMSLQDELRLDMQKQLANADLLSGKMLCEDKDSTTYILVAKVKKVEHKKPKEKITLQDNLLLLAILIAIFSTFLMFFT
jgi:hypothetical protein